MHKAATATANNLGVAIFVADQAGHTDIAHHDQYILHSILACSGVNVLYKRSDVQETLIERLPQAIWVFWAGNMAK